MKFQKSKYDQRAIHVEKRPNVRYRKSPDPDWMEGFIQAWNVSLCIDDVVKLTGYTISSASTRACQLRRKGIPLKKMGREHGAETFHKAWHSSTSIYEVAGAVGLTPICAYRKMLRLRKLGYEFINYALGLNKPKDKYALMNWENRGVVSF